jgi:hypothetical protein
MKRTRENILRLPMEKRAELAFREAVDEVITEHARLGLPLYVGRNGKVVKLSPTKLHFVRQHTALRLLLVYAQWFCWECPSCHIGRAST